MPIQPQEAPENRIAGASMQLLIGNRPHQRLAGFAGRLGLVQARADRLDVTSPVGVKPGQKGAGLKKRIGHGESWTKGVARD